MRRSVPLGIVAVASLLGAATGADCQAAEQGPERAADGGRSRQQARPDRLSAEVATGHAVISELRFVRNTDDLAPSAVAVVKHLARAINATWGTFLIEAHVDPSGDAAKEQALSERRATAVKARLVLDGVPPARVVAVGYGSTRPLAGVPAGQSARIEVARVQ